MSHQQLSLDALVKSLIADMAMARPQAHSWCFESGETPLAGASNTTILGSILLAASQQHERCPASLYSPTLCKLVERRTSRQTEVAERRCALEAQRDKAKDKLARLYLAIEDGVVEPDDDLKIRINALKQERDMAENALNRIVDTAPMRSQLTQERLAVFSNLMRDKLATGDISARKAYLRSVISRIEVGDDNIRIIGE